MAPSSIPSTGVGDPPQNQPKPNKHPPPPPPPPQTHSKISKHYKGLFSKDLVRAEIQLCSSLHPQDLVGGLQGKRSNGARTWRLVINLTATEVEKLVKYMNKLGHSWSLRSFHTYYFTLTIPWDKCYLAPHQPELPFICWDHRLTCSRDSHAK